MRDGPAGPRAALGPGGPDVWEVVGTLRAVGNRAERAARHLGLSVADVERAAAWDRAHPGEVDARLRRERELARSAEAEWRG